MEIAVMLRQGASCAQTGRFTHGWSFSRPHNCRAFWSVISKRYATTRDPCDRAFWRGIGDDVTEITLSANHRVCLFQPV
jgi:hypothetical protein